MSAKLYWFPISHPSQAVKKMLELKGIDYTLAGVLPGNQRVHLRLAGFRGGTVPALKLDGRRIEGSREIARALEALAPDPPLYPADPDARRRADEAERWGDEEFQNVPRRIFRHGLTQSTELRRWIAADAGLPMPGAAARVTGLNARYYARLVKATEDAARTNVANLPSLLDRVDALLVDGTISADEPSAASYQVLCTVRALDGFADFEELVARHPAGAAARKLFPEDFTKTPIPRFVPPDWL